MTQSADQLPHWDLDSLFPGPESPSFLRAWDQVAKSIDEIQTFFDQKGIGGASPPPAGEEVAVVAWVLEHLNAVLTRYMTINAYLYGLITENTANESAQGKWSELQPKRVQLHVLERRLTAWLGQIDLDRVIEESEISAEHAYFLARSRDESAHLMPPEMEALAARLAVTGSSAWGKLHADVTSQIQVDCELHGERSTYPMTAIRNMAFDPDPEVRQAAYRAELEAWRTWQVPLAGALNSIKGEVNAVDNERHWSSALDRALFENHIDRKALEAMRSATEAAFPHFRRYLKIKARLLGRQQLPWSDLFAPPPGEPPSWSFAESREFIRDQFSAFSPRLGLLAERAFNERWIDAEPRPGKVGGGFCMRVRGDESRILVNFAPNYDGMSTIAHELGHAYHNLDKAHRTMIQGETPMTLAETASTFCETIVQKAALDQVGPSEQIHILEAVLQGHCQLVVDIASRILFEEEIFERRAVRDLSAQEFCEVMTRAQMATYGEALDPDQLHPYMWAVKPHYYDAEGSFYNFPYTFGFLFSLGLYARYQSAPKDFSLRYDDLLSRTGMRSAADLALEFGVDVADESFWRESLLVVQEDIERFEALVESGQQH